MKSDPKPKTPSHKSDIDLREMDKANYENKLRVLEHQTMSEKRDKLKIQAELIHAKVLLLEQDMLAKLNIHKNRVGNHKTFIAELRERYGIPEGASFGHDPISGELHITRSK